MQCEIKKTLTNALPVRYIKYPVAFLIFFKSSTLEISETVSDQGKNF